jgi:hypothetical protein
MRCAKEDRNPILLPCQFRSDHSFPGLWLEDDVSGRFYLEMIQSLHQDI